MDDSGSSYPVFIGVWTNWSYGAVFGSTLTLTKQNGELLIAFVAFFVAFVGTQAWKIACFFLHRHYSARAPDSGFHHQRQAILRNSASPIGGTFSLLQVAWAWRKVSRAAILRLVPVILVTAAFASGLAAVSLLSSRIAIGNEVLISSPNCGVLSTRNSTSSDVQLYFDPQMNRRIETGAEYAQRCYSSNITTASDCNSFVQTRLPVQKIANAPCPFDPSVCLNSSASMMLDTGLLDSHVHLGINSPKSQRFQFRTALHCSPLATSGFKTIVNISDHESYSLYNYGDTLGGLYNYTWRASMDFLSQQQNILIVDAPIVGYQLSLSTAFYENGQLVTTSGRMRPIPALQRPDAELSVIGLMPNAILFDNPSPDDWYRATLPSFVEVLDSSGNTIYNGTVYRTDEPLWPLGCIRQWQICNPNSPNATHCTDLGTRRDVQRQAQTLYDDPKTGWWLHNLLVGKADLSMFIEGLGAQSLQSRYTVHDFLQGVIAPNQWQLDVEHWFSSFLASIQLKLLDNAVGPTNGDPLMERFVVKPENSEGERICQNQKIISAAYSCFSMFGLLFTLVLGTLIIIVSLTIEPLYASIRKRSNIEAYTDSEWDSNYVLHLQRLAYKELSASWRTGSWDVPVPESDIKLPSLNVQHDYRLSETYQKSIEKGEKSDLRNSEETGYSNRNKPGQNLILSRTNTTSMSCSTVAPPASPCSLKRQETFSISDKAEEANAKHFEDSAASSPDRVRASEGV